MYTAYTFVSRRLHHCNARVTVTVQIIWVQKLTQIIYDLNEVKARLIPETKVFITKLNRLCLKSLGFQQCNISGLTFFICS